MDIATESVHADSPSTAFRVDKVCAEVVRGPDRGATLEIGARPVLIGRAAACQLVLTDPTVSGMHAELRLVPTGVLVRNLASRNGIRAGLARMEEGVVETGVELVLGKTGILLGASAEQEDIPFAAVPRMGELVGRALEMKALFGILRQYAKADIPVLIEGETGTGKDLAAKALHDLSPRAQEPFEILDCGAIPHALLEAELFGVARGAYTGAVARPGVFERAGTGTVVLDEIGELPIELQPALLGVLERKEVRPLGDDRSRRVVARVIATTNRLLAREVQAGRFRQDLFFRLAVLRAMMPPLRRRKEDIPLLVEELLGAGHGLPPAWVRTLHDYHWPGNVRELKNALLRLQAHAARKGATGPLDPELIASHAPPAEQMLCARRRFEREYLLDILARAGQNVARAAHLAGLTRTGLYKLLRKSGISPPTVTAFESWNEAVERTGPPPLPQREPNPRNRK